MKPMEKMKEAYQQTPLPSDLDDFMHQSIAKAEGKQRKKQKRIALRMAACASFALYLIVLNTIPAFAKSVFKVPVLGDVSRILCLKQYRTESDVDQLSVKIPVIKNTGNKEMEDRVNKQINQRIEETTHQLYKESDQVRKMLKKENTTKLVAKTLVNIDYKITCNVNHLLSFQIITEYQMNTSMQEYQMFNLDLSTGKDITLEDLFGKNYEAIVNPMIKKQIHQQMKKDPKIYYFEGKMGFQGIRKNQPFYIDKQGNVVIVFEKYTIAPGYMGSRTFTIPCAKTKSYMEDTK